jgi:hypothetical protein
VQKSCADAESAAASCPMGRGLLMGPSGGVINRQVRWRAVRGEDWAERGFYGLKTEVRLGV